MRCRLALLAFPLAACAPAMPPPSIVVAIKPPSKLVHNGEGIHVHLETSDPLTLFFRKDGRWEKICDAPCDKNVSPSAEGVFLVTRGETRVTEDFRLDPPAGSQVTITVGPTQAPPRREPSKPWLTHLF